MRRLLTFVYGLAAYVACLATLLYLIGFSGDLLVPRSVDRGADGSALEAVLVDLLLLAAFGVQHSVMLNTKPIASACSAASIRGSPSAVAHQATPAIASQK